MNKPLLQWSLSLLAAATLAACAHNPQTGSNMNHHTTLKQYHWQLQTAKDASEHTLPEFYAKQNTPNVQLDFDDDGLSVYGSCNRLGAAYQLHNNQLHVNAVRGTLMGCPEALHQQDQALGHFLAQNKLRYELIQNRNAPILMLTNEEGKTLQFVGQATAQTRYGAEGETIFLEVAPQTKACQNGAQITQCLQVKEVRYDANGLKTHTDAQWQNFYGNIEGYTHQSNRHHILRLKRYPVQSPAADASQYAYVLDMIVMQAQVD